jgi:hypothetical protein
MRILLTFGLSGLMAAPALAADLEISVEIPKLDVAEYHKPYVAIWLEKPDQSVAANLAVWYDIANKKQEGDKWLKDLRQWWRRAGRSLTVPADGLTSATRAPGSHVVKLDTAAETALKDLAPGQYQIVIESAREVGGREVLRLPLQWPPEKGATANAKGEHELGAVSLNVKP